MDFSFLASLIAPMGVIPLFWGYKVFRWVVAGFGFILAQWIFFAIDLANSEFVERALGFADGAALVGEISQSQWIELLGLALGLLLSYIIYRSVKIIFFLGGFSVPFLALLTFAPIDAIPLPLWAWLLILLIPSLLCGYVAHKTHKLAAIFVTTLYGSYILANALSIGAILSSLVSIGDSLGDGGGEAYLLVSEELFAFDPVILTYQLLLIAVGLVVQLFFTAKESKS